MLLFKNEGKEGKIIFRRKIKCRFNAFEGLLLQLLTDIMCSFFSQKSISSFMIE